MGVVLSLVFQQIRTDTEVPWDVHSLLWNSIVREATLPGKSDWHCNTTTKAVTDIGCYTVQPCWAKSFRRATKRSVVYGLEDSVLTKGVRMTLYFAYPYCLEELGTIENHNSIIRRFLPKGTKFNLIGDKKIKEIQDLINTYLRKILNGFTPLQCFKEAFGLTNQTIKLLEACS